MREVFILVIALVAIVLAVLAFFSPAGSALVLVAGSFALSWWGKRALNR